MSRRITVVADRFPGRPGVDAAVSRSVLHRVASGELGETLRLYVPDRLVAFGSRDTVNPSYDDARSAAGAAGFGSYLRLAGGRAAVFHEHTIAFGWAIPDTDPRSTIERRFTEIDEILVEALKSVGLDARVGEVPGEYCPGSHSINAGGTAKVVGTGQRLIRGAAHVGGVVVVDRPDLVNRALVPVYDTLGYEWDPGATGAVAETTSADTRSVLDAIRTAFRSRHDLTEGVVDSATLALAEDPSMQRLR